MTAHDVHQNGSWVVIDRHVPNGPTAGVNPDCRSMGMKKSISGTVIVFATIYANTLHAAVPCESLMDSR